MSILAARERVDGKWLMPWQIRIFFIFASPGVFLMQFWEMPFHLGKVVRVLDRILRRLMGNLKIRGENPACGVPQSYGQGKPLEFFTSHFLTVDEGGIHIIRKLFVESFIVDFHV